MAERVLVIGAGIMGLTVAYELLQRGYSVELMDDKLPGSGATMAAGGMLAPTSEMDIAPAEMTSLGFDSLKRYPQFIAGLEKLTGVVCDFRTHGALWVAHSQNDLREFAHRAERMQKLDVHVKALTAEEILTREPYLSPRCQGGFAVPEDLQVDPCALTTALVKAIELLGGTWLKQHALEISDQQSVRYADGVAVADFIVVTTGAFTSQLLPQIAMRPMKGQALLLRGPELLKHTIRTPNVYLIPRAQGYLYVGATLEEQGFDLTPRVIAARELLQHAFAVMPGIDEFEMVKHFVGLRPVLKTHKPVIGKTPAKNVYMASGHYRDGILLAPATAFYLSEMIHKQTDILPQFSWEQACTL